MTVPWDTPQLRLQFAELALSPQTVMHFVSCDLTLLRPTGSAQAVGTMFSHVGVLRVSAAIWGRQAGGREGSSHQPGRL